MEHMGSNDQIRLGQYSFIADEESSTFNIGPSSLKGETLRTDNVVKSFFNVTHYYQGKAYKINKNAFLALGERLWDQSSDEAYSWKQLTSKQQRWVTHIMLDCLHATVHTIDRQALFDLAKRRTPSSRQSFFVYLQKNPGVQKLVLQKEDLKTIFKELNFPKDTIETNITAAYQALTKLQLSQTPSPNPNAKIEDEKKQKKYMYTTSEALVTYFANIAKTNKINIQEKIKKMYQSYDAGGTRTHVTFSRLKRSFGGEKGLRSDEGKGFMFFLELLNARLLRDDQN